MKAEAQPQHSLKDLYEELLSDISTPAEDKSTPATANTDIPSEASATSTSTTVTDTATTAASDFDALTAIAKITTTGNGTNDYFVSL